MESIKFVQWLGLILVTVVATATVRLVSLRAGLRAMVSAAQSGQSVLRAYYARPTDVYFYLGLGFTMIGAAIVVTFTFLGIAQIAQ